MDSYVGSNLEYLEVRIDLSIEVSFRLLRKISCSKPVVMAFSFSKKRVALIRNLKNGVLLTRLDKGVLFLW